MLSLATTRVLFFEPFKSSRFCRSSSSEYVLAIVELSDLIIARRQRILHHWDWIYWRTSQGKRFKKALDIVHGQVPAFVWQRRQLRTELQ